MIIVKDLIEVLTEEVTKDINVLDCGIRIDDRNCKVIFIHPIHLEKRTPEERKEYMDAHPYDHWKEVKAD